MPAQRARSLPRPIGIIPGGWGTGLPRGPGFKPGATDPSPQWIIRSGAGAFDHIIYPGGMHAEQNWTHHLFSGRPGRVGHSGPGGAFLGGQAGGGYCQDPGGHRPGHDPSRHAQGVHGNSRRPPLFLAVLHPVGYLGRLDIFFRGRLWRGHGRRRPYHRFWSGGLRPEF